MPDIASITPFLVRPQDTITITGSCFDPFGSNVVEVDLIPATVLQFSEKKIVATVPLGLPTDTLVSVRVTRTDTAQTAFYFLWMKPSQAGLLGLRLPMQIPGPGESPDFGNPTTPQAKDYERYAEMAELLPFDVLGAACTFVARDDVGPARVGPPPTSEGRPLTVALAAPAALHFAHRPEVVTFPFGLEIAAGVAVLGEMVACGTPEATFGTNSEHGVPFAGRVLEVVVYVVSLVGGDVLDQVQLHVSGALAFDSGTGLALGADKAYRASVPTFALGLLDEDYLEVFAKKLGVAGVMRLSGWVRAEAGRILEVFAQDSVTVTDSLVASLTIAVDLGLDEVSTSDSLSIAAVSVAIQDEVQVSDALEVGGVFDVAMQDTLVVVDSLLAAMVIAVDLGLDQVTVSDSLEINTRRVLLADVVTVSDLFSVAVI